MIKREYSFQHTNGGEKITSLSAEDLRRGGTAILTRKKRKGSCLAICGGGSGEKKGYQSIRG